MQLLQSLLGLPFAYVALQRFVAPEREEHLRQVLKDHRLLDAVPTKVLDLGFGSGTNAGLFACCETYHYVGIDSNQTYVKAATERHGLDFRCDYVTTLHQLPVDCDLVLPNSVLHHLDDEQTKAAISTAVSNLKQSGKLVALDQVAAGTESFSTIVRRYLLRLDKGDHCRNALAPCDMSARHFSRIEYSRFVTDFLRVQLWDWEMYVCHEPSSPPSKNGEEPRCPEVQEMQMHFRLRASRSWGESTVSSAGMI